MATSRQLRNALKLVWTNDAPLIAILTGVERIFYRRSISPEQTPALTHYFSDGVREYRQTRRLTFMTVEAWATAQSGGIGKCEDILDQVKAITNNTALKAAVGAVDPIVFTRGQQDASAEDGVIYKMMEEYRFEY